MKVGDKVQVTYSDGVKIGEIKKETTKQYQILFEDGELRRVNKTQEIKKLNLRKEVKSKSDQITATTSKPIFEEKIEKPVETKVETIPYKGDNIMKKLWPWIIIALGIAALAIAKSQGAF